MLATLLWSFADAAEEGHGGYWFIYWTHWTLGVEVAYLTVAAFATWRFAGTDPAPVSATGGTPWWIKGMWVLYDVSFPGTFFVFALYWLLVYTPPARVLSCMTHGAPPDLSRALHPPRANHGEADAARVGSQG
jgi:cytochrome b561